MVCHMHTKHWKVTSAHMACSFLTLCVITEREDRWRLFFFNWQALVGISNKPQLLPNSYFRRTVLIEDHSMQSYENKVRP